MQTSDKAEAVFERSVTEALGYCELAQEQLKHGCDISKLTRAAIEALQRFSNDDDLVDAMYESDMAHDYNERAREDGVTSGQDWDLDHRF